MSKWKLIAVVGSAVVATLGFRYETVMLNWPMPLRMLASMVLAICYCYLFWVAVGALLDLGEDRSD